MGNCPAERYKMGVIRDLDRLKPELSARVKNFLAECKKQNIGICVVETLRTADVQAAYYARGRKPFSEVKDLYEKAGLGCISEADAKTKITNCDGAVNKSRHQGGGAVDLVPLKNGRAWWSAPEQIWTEIGTLAEKFGLDWCAGGYGQVWGKGWDNPHFELLENWRR